MQPAQEKDILDFMTLTGCQDEQKAMQYLQMGDNKLENAIQLYLDLEGQPVLSQQSSVQSTKSPYVQNQQQFLNQNDVKEVNTMIFNENNPPPELIRQRSAPDSSLAEKYKKYQEDKRANDDGIIKKTFKYGWNALTYIFKREPNYGLIFQTYIQQQQIQTAINFQMGNFNDNLKRAHEETKPLLIYLHNQQALFTFEKMINCKNFVTIIQRNYHIVGFLESPQVYELLPVKPQPPTLLIYRLDLTEQAILMDTVQLSPETNFEELAIKLKILKGQFNKQFIVEDQVKREFNAPQYVPNYYGQQQQQQQQQQNFERRQQEIQQREREQLIRQQQEAYRIAEQQAAEKKRKEQELKQLEEHRLLEQQQLSEIRLLQKATMLSNLPDEPEGEEGIEILYRFMHATRTRRFNFNDKIQSIFEFALSQEDDCFNDPNSNIDLIQNFPRLSLKDKKDDIISDVFTDANKVQLIVEECE
ncbi:unnamed protein product (macronuclear) [Paramecium tetraurelia]|uniref:UBX domain-containing protein n=1 Tax=Paramecium tetraurelia TaxID=5888 RepID=A0E6F9_PARTE|nr:uncharacterized protein GSPATT00003741001 [Paramecium tetraurelia]CAK90876.1 unnamed protein product [Paramecium tetraurelia]|eukprot:XP_001458273.1 hypothetical protein (macronuclear) [Paramecium tetraurelia strain d4-2]